MVSACLTVPFPPGSKRAHMWKKSILDHRHEEPECYFMNTHEGFFSSDNYYHNVTLWICDYQGLICVTVAFKCHITTRVTRKKESNLAECSYFFLVMGTFGHVWQFNLLNIPQILKFLNDRRVMVDGAQISVCTDLLLFLSLVLTPGKQCSISQVFNKRKGCQCY